MKTLPFAALTLFPLAFATAAVNPGIVPADSRWLIYLDLNSIRASSPGKEIVAYAEQQREEVGSATVGIDVQKLLTTVGAVTAFGSNFTSDPKALDGAILLQGTPDLRKIIEGLIIQQTVTNPEAAAEIKDLPFPAYGLKSPHRGPGNPATPVASTPAANDAELVVAFPPEPIVIVSKSRAQILNARAAFIGSIPTLARAATAPLKDLLSNANDAYLFAASVVPSDQYFPDDKPQARILRMTTSGSVAIGQRASNTYAHVVLVSANDDSADKLTKILQGITAMLSLAETNDRQLADFLNSAKVDRNNQVVTLDVAYASDRLGQMVKTLINEPPSHHGPPMMHGGHEVHVTGEVVGQWQAQAGNATVTPQTIPNVKLANGAVVALTRQSNGGKGGRFERVEIAPSGGGAPLVFRTDLMRTLPGGPRSQGVVFEFPGADGVYTLKITYANDPEGKATYTVTVREPKSDADSAPKPAAEEPPAQKTSE